ncbi:hypothetical protein BSKO_00672 [Bryopsis sp. KO-2023]|nr:hypothetical protein BSKO_00672 [Bryopsis sp. KO-2023]
MGVSPWSCRCFPRRRTVCGKAAFFGLLVLAFALLLSVARGEDSPGPETQAEKDSDSSLGEWIDDCGVPCLAGIIAVAVGVGVCVPLTMWFILCQCRSKRSGSFRVTDEGLSVVAEKAMKRLEYGAKLTPPTNKPRSGRYEGACTDIHQTKRVTYMLTFHDNGSVTGNTLDEETPFEIQGHFNHETGKYHWGETLLDAYYKNYDLPEVYSTALINGEALHVEVEADAVDTDKRVLEAHYFDSTNSTGFITLTWTEPLPSTVEVEHDAEIEHRRLVV